jgi:hypothetical protein
MLKEGTDPISVFCDALSDEKASDGSDASRQGTSCPVAIRFGLVPNFFSSAPDAPEIIEGLWVFA